MELVVVGLNHLSASLELREKLDFSKHSSEIYLPKLAEAKSVKAGVVLSTCNRVEIYAAGNEADELLRDTTQFITHFHELADIDFSKILYSKLNRDAVKHLFRVASSLDSMMLGEPQILGQVKEAYYAASHQDLVDPFLDRLFRKAFSVSKRVRSETKVAAQAVSLSYAAVELAKKIFGALTNESVMILGAGEMAELAAKHLKQSGVNEMFFANRSYDHAFDLAKEYGGIPIPLDQFPKYLKRVDIVIVSTAAPEYIVKPAQVQETLTKRKQSPMFFIDISVPRNIDPRIDRFENIYLYNIDDLQNIVNENLKGRQDEASKAEAIIDMEVEQFFRNIEKLEVAPMIVEVQEKMEVYRQAELSRLKGRMKNISEEEWKEVERSMESFLKKVVSEPIAFLKDEDSVQNIADRSETVRRVFGLDKKRDDQ